MSIHGYTGEQVAKSVLDESGHAAGTGQLALIADAIRIRRNVVVGV